MAINLELIRKELRKGRDIEEIIAEIDWQEFEDLSSKILEENGWKVKKNFRFKTESRYEIDILATRGDKELVVDCKHWGIRTGKPTQLRHAAEKQAERAKELGKMKFLDSPEKRNKIFPVIVTLFQEDIISENNVFIVPVFKLNSFLVDIDDYLE